MVKEAPTWRYHMLMHKGQYTIRVKRSACLTILIRAWLKIFWALVKCCKTLQSYVRVCWPHEVHEIAVKNASRQKSQNSGFRNSGWSACSLRNLYVADKTIMIENT